MSESRLLLCTDMDRTVIPNGAAAELSGARERFARLCRHPMVTLAYVTGRHRKLVEEALEIYQLPQPDYVISDVGTQMYRVTNSEWQGIADWESAIAEDWNGYSREEIQGLLSHFSSGGRLLLQEHDKQNTYKLSYYFPVDADPRGMIAQMKAKLSSAGVRATVVWSLDEPNEVGLLDVLPERATKWHAVAFLQNRLGFAEEELVFAGDSGNDLPVLVSPLPSVLVANASEAVRRQAVSMATENGNSNRLYLAGAADSGSQSPQGNYSDGVIEGVLHYRPEFGPL